MQLCSLKLKIIFDYNVGIIMAIVIITTRILIVDNSTICLEYEKEILYKY
jgi:hypothetical protein